MAPLRINTTDSHSYRQLRTPANSSSVITYAKNNNVAEYRCRQLGLVELVFNMSTILLYDSLQATPPLFDRPTVIN